MIRVMVVDNDMATGSEANPLAISSTIAGAKTMPAIDVKRRAQNRTVATWSAKTRVARRPCWNRARVSAAGASGGPPVAGAARPRPTRRRVVQLICAASRRATG